MERDVTDLLPKDSILHGAFVDEEMRLPSDEEKRRGQFREDIQRAVAAVDYPGGIFGTPRPAEASGYVGASITWTNWLVGWVGFPDGRKLMARSELISTEPRHMRMALEDIERQITSHEDYKAPPTTEVLCNVLPEPA